MTTSGLRMPSPARRVLKTESAPGPNKVGVGKEKLSGVIVRLSLIPYQVPARMGIGQFTTPLPDSPE